MFWLNTAAEVTFKSVQLAYDQKHDNNIYQLINVTITNYTFFIKKSVFFFQAECFQIVKNGVLNDEDDNISSSENT